MTLGVPFGASVAKEWSVAPSAPSLAAHRTSRKARGSRGTVAFKLTFDGVTASS